MIAIILFILYFFLFVMALKKLSFFRSSGIPFERLLFFFLIKVVAGVLLVLVYTYYYTDRSMADIYKYFDDANVIYASLFEHPKAFFKILTNIRFGRNNEEIRQILAATHHFDKQGGGYLESNHHLIIRANVFCRLFSLGSIYIHTLFFNMLSFVGLVGLYKAFKNYFEELPEVLYIPLFLLPSVLFWGSGLLKESLLFFFLGMLVFASFRLMRFHSIVFNLLLILICFSFLWNLKPFVAISFAVSFYLMAVINFKGYFRIISFLLATGIVLFCMYAHQAVFCEIAESILAKRNEFIALGNSVNAGSLLEKNLYPVQCWELFKLLPIAFLNTFFHPFILDKSNLFEKLFAVENLFLTALIIYFITRAKSFSAKTFQLFVFAISFCLLNYLLIGLSVPIMGAIVRYKTIAMPFLLIAVLSVVNLKKIIYDIEIRFGFKK